MKKYIYIIFCSVLSIGCFNQTIEKQIANEIDTKCASKACTININQFTPFAWDKMYVIGPQLSGDRIKEVIGIDYPVYKEFSRPIIFIKKNEIVYFENNYEDEESATDGHVVFDYPDSVYYKAYFSGKAIFKAEIKKFDGRRYFVLSQPGTK